jgi:hypothetical protein
MLDCQYYVAWFVASLMMAGAWVLTEIIQRFGPWQNFFIKFLTEKGGLQYKRDYQWR